MLNSKEKPIIIIKQKCECIQFVLFIFNNSIRELSRCLYIMYYSVFYRPYNQINFIFGTVVL